jgi:hypothetical protein
MPTLDDVASIVATLPEADEGTRHGGRTWSVRDKTFAWERTFSKADLKRFGDDPVPSDPILAVAVEDLNDKESVLASGRPGVFTIPHFDGYAAVLVELGETSHEALEELLIDGWLAKAPATLARAYLGKR